ncbi:hypothetical protein LINPERHAP1_LOCUS17439, partial [Linum perenne]
QSAIVAHFLGNIPPVKVIRGVINCLLGFDGKVVRSVLSTGFFLIELPSIKLSEWILAWSWHIHHSSMILRQWVQGVMPLDFAPKEVPVRIILKEVLPTLTPKGISWLASPIGHPINKYIRDGLDVKVCVIKEVLEAPLSSIAVMVEENESKVITVKYPELRSYKRSHVWLKGKETVSQPQVIVSVFGSSGNVPKLPLSAKETPEARNSKQVGGGTGNGPKVYLQVKGTPVQQGVNVLSPKSIKVSEDGALMSDDE